MTSAILCLTALLGTLVLIVTAQNGGLPDSISDVDCFTLQMDAPHICCEPDTGNFCQIQCNNGFCRCVDPLTGVPTTDFTFPDNDESISCDLIVPDPDPETTTTEEVTTTEEITTTEEVTSMEEITSTEEPTMPTTEPVTSTEEPTEEPTTSPPEEQEPETTEENIVEEEEPTTDEPDDEDDSDSSESSDSKETSFSLTDSTDTRSGTTRSTSRRTGTTRGTTRGRTGTTRTTGGRTGTTRTTGGRTLTGTTRTTNGRTGTSGTTRRSGSTRTSGGTRSTGRTRTTGRTGTTGRSGSHTTRSRSNTRCPIVRDLLRRGCTESCLIENADGCPMCDRCCLELETATNASSTGEDPTENTTAMSDTPCSCDENQVCLRVGRFGEHKCVDLLTEGERCDAGRDDDDEDESNDDEDSTKKSKSRSVSDFDETSRSTARRRVGGARDRRLYGDLGEATVDCQDGLICTPVEFGRSECRPESAESACVIAREGGAPVTCAADGSFEPLQCQPVGDLFQCQCVNPSDGGAIPSTEVVVANVDDAPDCDRLVGCTVERAGQSFGVSHGEFFVNIESCQRCLCSNGQATLCEQAVCTALQRAPQGCSYQGQSYNHGDEFLVDCNACGCRNGQIRCTRTQCARSQIRDRCQECMSEPLDQVCGINGVTYDSPCAAVYCGGLAPFDFFRGACSSVDICALYPCGEGESCLRKGGVVCFDDNGCDPDDLRLCVNRNSLECQTDSEDDPSEDANSDNDDAVCATNGVTYPSLCRLLQDTGNEAVAYAGECDREECQGGSVCGTDGVTYENVCVLRAQSANARVDYDGECEEVSGESPDQICQRVSQARRCIYNSSNCRHLVRPEEGCCALCGGISYIAMDLAGLRNYVNINPAARTLDDFIEVLVDAGFIDEEITERCELDASFTVTGNVQVSLSAKTDADSEFCHSASEEIVNSINNPSSAQLTRVPEILQFASAAVAAPNLIDEQMNGATTLMASSFFTLLILFAFIFAIL